MSIIDLKITQMNFKEATNKLLATVKLEDLCDRLGIEIKRAGSSVKALCQFHKDTKPSMELYDDNPEKSAFHCFSCGAHGDIFALVKEVKGMDFREAHTWLCSEYGIEVDQIKRKFATKTPANSLSSLLENVYQYALDFYKKHQNEIELAAFLRERGYEKDFGLNVGLCLVGSRSLVHHLNSLDYPDDTHKAYVFDKYESAGLIKKNSVTDGENVTINLRLDNLYYDHFKKGRLLFPIRNSEGEIQGFAGRSINDSVKPKYLFSKGMNKSSLLYRSESAFENIKRSRSKTVSIYLCEGLFDALRLESVGLNAVAVLGASLTDEQCTKLLEISSNMSKKQRFLELNLFFDNDSAGIRATDTSIRKIIKNLGLSNVVIKVYYSKSEVKVDPDSFLKGDDIDAKALLSSIEFPFPAINLSQELNISPLAVEDNNYFKDLPYSMKVRAAKKWSQLFDDGEASFILDEFERKYCDYDWFKLLKSASLGKKSGIQYKSGTFIGDTKQRIHLAFSIAKSAMSNAGQFPDNDAEWRRVEMCLPILENIISDRFSDNYDDLGPIEPLNTIHVSRDISGEEYREMSLHCVEDLTSHQYVLSELLTERCDFKDNFSLNIPATRYYRTSNTTITTGEGEKSEHSLTLSFAYQIDMEVLEGREVAGSSGMFRPYFECWKEFTRSINKAANQMSQVHMVRLDLKRYYDRLQRYVLQDALRDCIPDDLSKYEQDHLLELVQGNGQDKKSKVIDWLLDQSFGYKKYDPKTGEVLTSDAFIGIPQGPDLSSYLANLVLFKVDSKAREFIECNKEPETERYTAWYARYVDDMVLIAEDTSTLSKLRMEIEDAVRKLELELIAKEQPTAMTAEEFGVYLTQGKALASSGPTGNVELVNIEDINFFGRIERYQALSLLNNKDLYSDDLPAIKSKLNMAMHCSQLRFSDVKKVSKWVWFVAVKEAQNNSTYDLVSTYQTIWTDLVNHMETPFSPMTCPWEDPLLLAFDGLNQLISRNNSWVNDSLSESNIIEKENVRKYLIDNINSDLLGFLANENPQNIVGWGISQKELVRTFWQKRISLLWHASQYNSKESEETEYIGMFSKLERNHKLKVSLIRTHLTELQITSRLQYNSFESTHSNDLRDFCLLIQVVYLHLSNISQRGNKDIDVLSPVIGEIRKAVLSFEGDITTRKILSLFIPDEDDCLLEVDSKLIVKILYFVCSITADTQQIRMLSSRWNSLINRFLGEGNYTLISPLPTIDEHSLFGYRLDEDNKIDSLIKVTSKSLNSAENNGESLSENDDLYVSNSNDINFSKWSKSIDCPDSLKLVKTKGDVLKGANYILTSPPPIIRDVDKKLLSWSATTYRSLIDCIREGQKIPTWCNTSMSVIPPLDKLPEANQVCIIASKDRTTSYPQAFIRNGGKSLRPLQVPSHNVSFWQAGVALTDMLGFTRDLDAYAKVDETFEAISESPQTRLLKNSLKKLNGSLYFSKPVYAPEEEMVPKSIERTLELLESFPDTSETNDVYLYGFVTEMETQVMRLRLSSHTNPTENGKLIQMYAEAVKATLARVPLDWFAHLPKITLEVGSEFRSCERFWIVLYEVFSKSFQKSNLIDETAELHIIKNAILLGCQVNLIEASLKAAVFESHASGEIDSQEFQGIDVNDAFPSSFFGPHFSLAKYIVSDDSEENSLEGLGNYFSGLLKDKAQQHSFSAITPLGWLLIALIKKGLVSKGTQKLDRKHRKVQERLANSNLIRLVTLESKESLSGLWPFEHDLDEFDIGKLLDDLSCLHSVGLSNIVDVENQHFDYDPQKDEFKGLWKLKKWQIALAASNTKDNKPFYTTFENRLVSSWTETYVGDNLVYVSSLGRLYGGILDLVSSHHFPKPYQQSETEKQISEVTTPSSTENVVSGQEVLSRTRDKIISNDKRSSEQTTNTENVGSNTQSPTTPLAKVFEKLVGINRRAWRLRKNDRAPSHARVAMFQMDLKEKYGDGYYTHYSKNKELLDDCNLGPRCKEIRDKLSSKDLDSSEREALVLEQQGCLTNEKCFKLYNELKLFNIAEVRRRALLKEVIESCIRLGVDLLVLPEYSVQPATIVWLKKFLRGKEISVLAGTYRLPEGYPASKLKDLTSNQYSKLVSEFQSVMTLLVPYQGDKVLSFNRAKKYASPAANELISPYQKKIEPLFTLEMLEAHLCEDFSGERLALTDITTLMKTPHISLLGFIQELICAELFLLTNPVNYLNLATEYKNLSNKFGFIKTDTNDEAVKAVLDDIKNISFHLSGDTGDQINSFQPFNRSIVTIPAMTSRKQDYWIFGQGAMLANGISTIFCNALCGKDSTGGSCFIGLDSWIGDKKKPFITPYSGWSKGIYYGDKTDTLQKEQSFVVVDIDPKMMSLGSPRPQALPVPMKLVAHVPVIELQAGEESKLKHLTSVVGLLEGFYKSHKDTIVNPDEASDLIKTLEDWFELVCDGDQKSSLSSRISEWKKSWRVNPQVGTAALTDWIAVEIPTLLEGDLDD
ncbi:CHC2 zinc finger domain-containing protein [Vibrio furnissii]|uniref:CHC2 zinc finger domain-containing protein n=1 Tax=Vibrio furnissii TaxID=29494 RepID=UPI002573DA46|nr:CHC2 zinc finger domain-containing protein [Vibrio furnissii]WJG24158.1 CHC2 zinc finger domain-containing protein [Vibrio furnissii]